MANFRPDFRAETLKVPQRDVLPRFSGIVWSWNDFQQISDHKVSSPGQPVCVVSIWFGFGFAFLMHCTSFLMQCFGSTLLSSSNRLFNLNVILFIPSQHIKWNQTVEFENVIYHVSSHHFLLFVCFSIANIDDENKEKEKNKRECFICINIVLLLNKVRTF